VTLLLDTHALLWFLLDDPRLSPLAAEVIGDERNGVLVSPASLWEIAIKISQGKYELPVPFEDFFEEQLASNRLCLLAITPRHAAVVARLPFHHRDPFDRLITAQALVENIPLVSGDAVLEKYAVRRLW
jgi:PIN domain nuclease of toxin-antitoxin system